jgi:hypothetical protein
MDVYKHLEGRFYAAEIHERASCWKNKCISIDTDFLVGKTAESWCLMFTSI